MLANLQTFRLSRSLFLLHPPCRRTVIVQRNYALSRFPGSRIGSRRVQQGKGASSRTSRENEPPISESELWEEAATRTPSDPKAGLERILLSDQTVIIERQLEMLNIFLGFEQCNRYSISSANGETLGYITEEPGGILSSISRQAFGTHRPFKALIMDLEGSPLLWLRRPFAWINSRMYVQRSRSPPEFGPNEEQVLDTFAEVQQVWHPWRRKYDLFLREPSRRILSLATDPQPSPEPESDIFNQFAKVDSGFLAWNFELLDGQGDPLGFISRSFRGFGREIFTDTGMYSVTFGVPMPSEALAAQGVVEQPRGIRDLTLEERALVLALAVNIDFDYFSRHSGPGGVGFLHFGTWE